MPGGLVDQWGGYAEKRIFRDKTVVKNPTFQSDDEFEGEGEADDEEDEPGAWPKPSKMKWKFQVGGCSTSRSAVAVIPVVVPWQQY